MNLTNDAGENDNEKNSSSDEDEDNENTYTTNSPSILVEKFFSSNKNNEELDNSDDDNDDDDDGSDIENHYTSDKFLPRQNHLCTILRQSNRLTELKLNLLHNHLLLRHSISDSDMSKQNDQQRNNIYLSSIRLRRLYLPSSFIYELQTQITNWLQSSTCLIDSISTSIYHRRCWSQLLLTYFIEQRFVNLQFLLCTHSLSLTTIDHDLYSIHQHTCIPEEDAYKLCSILQKGSRFNIDSNIFDHIRRIIVIKSMKEVFNDNINLQQLYIKQLTSLKQYLIHQQSSVLNMNNNLTISVASIYSKLLLFLSSLYSIRAETMQILFCQHLLHNPMYSYLVNS
ncbi:unnamed protein product [Rotaria sp. Silwood1]|nr:unnamed protein product [Rotaria sp. Silwood1]CAF3551360.1 unnamed protein product [Rotaria sp. Silwood1]CAF3555581.1 unnamed protein product [Rotaria sp. Silwood1]CAF3615403.1 unnamed protein product [Rotaria sp. Silwood1]